MDTDTHPLWERREVTLIDRFYRKMALNLKIEERLDEILVA